jgi:acetolactate synthase-1/2/3 large subunit
MTSTGETLVTQLQARGVDTVFGIPGVHTVELYRGLARSGMRHITPRHEQGAGFMADGYARVSGKPGVAFVITGPGLTNTLTPMAQARADSIPMLVVTSVNRSQTLGQGIGHLHELPNQHALASTVALISEHVSTADQLTRALDNVFAPFIQGRAGPTHIQIPMDIAADNHPQGQQGNSSTKAVDQDAPRKPWADPDQLAAAAALLNAAENPVILAGGGAKTLSTQLTQLAERLGAPVVQTVNARGVMFGHPLSVPASPSLRSVRALIEQADAVIAIGTELGPTDYDMYDSRTMPQMASFIRIDICAEQLARHSADIAIRADAEQAVNALLPLLVDTANISKNTERAAQCRRAAWIEIGPEYQSQVEILNAMRAAVPGAIMVGDSAQPIYAGNMYFEPDRPGGWFNAATGYGALGYGIPAAIGAAVAAPDAPVICIVGDGGAQFSLPEIMAAVDEKLPITFVVWNNSGYHEIASSMQHAGVEIVGCDPTPPDFQAAAQSFGITYQQSEATPQAITDAMLTRPNAPNIIEIRTPKFRADPFVSDQGNSND